MNPAWQRLAAQLALSDAQRDAAWMQFQAHYQAAGRHYHTLAHLADLLAWQERFATELQDSLSLQLAIWYHDLVYDPLRSDNEAQSAARACHDLRQWGLSAARIARVERLILATAGHQPRSEDLDERWFLDFDLSILGAKPTRYAAYAQAIRQEYAAVPDAAYRTGRSQLLQKLLDRPQLYFTPVIRAEREAQARVNLAQEWQALVAGAEG